MRQASSFISEPDRQRINQAVAAAESRTSAELVPVVATVSGRYDRPEDIVGLWTAVLTLVAAWLLLPKDVPEPGSWGGFPLWVRLLVLVTAVIVGFIAGAVAGARVDWLRNLFTPAQQKRDEVFRRAREVFFDTRIHHTAGRTGLLLYVSLFEHVAAVLADQAVLEKLGQPALDELRDRLTAALRTHSLADALGETIAAAGERLSAVLPRAGNDVNELPDALVVLDQAR